MDSGMELEIFHLVLKFNVRWDGPIGVATRCWMDCPEIESQWERDRFPATFQSGPKAGPASCTKGKGSLSRW
jgi:hypothetical protein